jgi:hypothetical protein
VLYIVLALVVAAFGLLIAALATANTLWAWISVGVSVVAAVLLVLDWLAGRRRVAATVASPADRTDGDVDVDEATAVEPFPVGEPADNVVAEESPPADAEPSTEDDPAEETTDATDLLVISDLPDEVRVVDEHPRYHLTACTWLAGRPTLPLPVSEARQLGFTPCARCGPDAALAARHRADKGAEQ